MYLIITKSVLKSKNILLMAVSRPKWVFKIFWNIPGSFLLDFQSKSHRFKRISINIFAYVAVCLTNVHHRWIACVVF